jgi:ribosomal protein S27AE
MSKVRYARMQEYRKKRDVFLKKNPLCARCGKKSIDLHHSKGRIGRLLCADEHWFAVCRTCHNWIGDNPNQAREEGFLCQLGQWNTV